MEKILFKKGLFITSWVLRLMTVFFGNNLINRLKVLIDQTGIKAKYISGVLNDALKVIDAGSGTIYIKTGMAVMPDHEVLELTVDSDTVAVPDDSTTYSILLIRTDNEKEAGTIAVTNGSLVLIGTDTKFTETLAAGDRILLDSSNPANQGTLIVAAVATGLPMIIVEPVDAEGNDISFTTENDIDWWVIGKFAAGYPIGGENKHIRNYDGYSIVLTTTPGSYSNYVKLAEVSNTGGVLTLTDKRVDSLLWPFDPSMNTNYDISRTASKNLFDTPAPNPYGGGTVWVEGITIANTPILLDNSIDWRDRIISITAYLKEDASPLDKLPGGSGQAGVIGHIYKDDADSIYQMATGIFYSGPGMPGNPDTNYYSVLISYNITEYINIFVDNGTQGNPGCLYCIASAVMTNEYAFILKIDYSPGQNHI